MIHGVFGKLGAGKGLLVMDIIAKELIDGFRDVVTNVPIRILPWVNGQGIPQIGLRQYLLEKLSPLGEDEIDELLKRVLVIEDIDKGADLFMWRRDGETSEWFKLEVTKKDEKGRPERFDANEIKTRHCAPCLVVTDEAWQFYPNNGGWARVPLLPFYARQQRKLRDEWFIVTQHPTDVDMVLWNIAQDFWVCRNHGMERMGIFRQPAMFRVIIYLTNPAKGNAIRSHEIYRVLDKKLSQCYDTTAGVGISGGFKGDSNQKKRGLHWAWLIVGVLIMVVGLASVPYVLSHMSKPFLTRSLSGHASHPTNSVPEKKETESSSSTFVSQRDLARDEKQFNTADTVYCTGFLILNGQPRAFLSDGTVAEPPELQQVAKNFVIISGVKMQIILGHSYLDEQEVYSSPAFTPAESSSTRSSHFPTVQVVTVPPDHRQMPPRLNGFSSLANRYNQ